MPKKMADVVQRLRSSNTLLWWPVNNGFDKTVIDCEKYPVLTSLEHTQMVRLW